MAWGSSAAMRAFVTGASGFIGRRLVQRLVRSGADVTALMRRVCHCSASSASTAGRPANVTVARGALEDGPEKLAEAMAGHDVVFHLAALVSFNPRQLPELLRVNGDGTQAVLSAAGKASVGRTVVVSSACTIGLSCEPDRVLDEETPFDPRLETRNPYLRSKRLAEAHAVEAAHAGQWVTTVNPTTVYGSGDHSVNSGSLVRQVAQARALPVPPGGSNVVDIDDVVAGILAAAQRGRSGARYILGGENLGFGEIIDRIVSVVGRRPLLIPLPSVARLPMAAAAWFVHRLTGSRLITPQIIADTFAYKYYSSRRAESELGWRAERDFTSTLSAAWAYYQREGLIPMAAGAAA
jgi:dihydroflavonol-4-reductase